MVRYKESSKFLKNVPKGKEEQKEINSSLRKKMQIAKMTECTLIIRKSQIKSSTIFTYLINNIQFLLCFNGKGAKSGQSLTMVMRKYSGIAFPKENLEIHINTPNFFTFLTQQFHSSAFSLRK